MPTNDSAELIAHAAEVTGRIWLDGFEWRKVGVLLVDLTKTVTRQVGLFVAVDRAKSAALMGVLDEVSRRYGRGALKFAAEGTRQGWPTKRENLSPPQTTRRDELPMAIA